MKRIILIFDIQEQYKIQRVRAVFCKSSAGSTRVLFYFLPSDGCRFEKKKTITLVSRHTLSCVCGIPDLWFAYIVMYVIRVRLHNMYTTTSSRARTETAKQIRR